MAEPSFGKYVLSYGRAFTATTQELVPDAVWVVRKSQEADYRAAGHQNILAVDDDEIGGLCEVNNWIINNAPEDIICVMDDDLKHFFYRMYDTDEITDIDTIAAEMEHIAQIMIDLDIGFAATDPTTTPWNYTSEFEFKGIPGAVRWINRRVYKATFRKEYVWNCDIDVVLQELLANRIILKPKYFCSKGCTDTNEGGASSKKRGDQVACIHNLMTVWGKYFTYDFRKNKPQIRVER